MAHGEPQSAEPVGRELYLAASRDLELHFDREHAEAPVGVSGKIVVSDEVSSRLQSFVVSDKEPVLAIAGPRSADHQGVSTSTKIAASFIDYARTIGFPVVTWFCGLYPSLNEQREGTSEERALIALVYALIRQLMELLPSRPNRPIKANLEDLSKLDGTPKTIVTAVQLLKDLLTQADVTLFVVVDGLQWLDDISTSRHLPTVIRALVGASTYPQEQYKLAAPLVRVLFTTAGRSGTLLDTLDTRAYLLKDEGAINRRASGGHVLAW